MKSHYLKFCLISNKRLIINNLFVCYRDPNNDWFEACFTFRG